MQNFDPEIVSRKLKYVEKRLKRLEQFREILLEDYLVNFDAQDIIERNLEVLIQAAVDVNKYILSRTGRLTVVELEKTSNAESFLLLAQAQITSQSLAEELAISGRFRNVLAHLYDDLIPSKVLNALQKALECYPEYLYAIQSYLDTLEE